ncbi:hypothetical protein D3C87_257250 [compost metagenome]
MEIYHEVVYKSRHSIVLVLVALASVILFCGGFFISLIQATTQYDRNGYIAFTASVGAGLVLMAISLLAFYYVFFIAWPGIKAHKQEQLKHAKEQHSRTSLDEALGTLVNDFANDRRQRRQTRRQYREAKAAERESYRQRRKSSRESPPVHH